MNQERLNSIKSGRFPYACHYDATGKRSDFHWKVYTRDFNPVKKDNIAPTDEMLNVISAFRNKKEAKEFYDLYLAPLIEKAIHDAFKNDEEYQKVYRHFPRFINARLYRATELLSFVEYSELSPLHSLAIQEYRNFCQQLKQEPNHA